MTRTTKRRRATSRDDVTTHIVAHLHRQFLKDGNALDVWSAYRYVRRQRIPTLKRDRSVGLMAAPPLPMPAWIAEYLDGVADALLDGTPSARDVDRWCTRALQLKTRGGHSKFLQLADASRNSGIYSYIDFCLSVTPDETKPRLKGDLTTLDRICKFVAKETRRPGNGFSSKRLSAKTVKGIYYDLKPKS